MNKKILMSSFLIVTSMLFATESKIDKNKVIDKIEVYPVKIYNKKENLKLRKDLDEILKDKIENKIFKHFDFSDKEAFKKVEHEKNGKKYYEIENELKDDYQDYFYELVDIIARSNFLETEYSRKLIENEKKVSKDQERPYYGEFYDTEVFFNDFHRHESIERFMKRSMGVPTELNLELVKKNMGGTDNNLYHLILSSKKMNNRNVAVIPFLINNRTKTITRFNEDFVFITPQKVYNGLSEFFNTFLITKNKKDYRNETGRYTEERDNKDFAKVINGSTEKIADTRKNEKYNRYIEKLLDEKIGFYREERFNKDSSKKENTILYDNKVISKEEYEDIMDKAKRILHNYQYSEVTPLKLPNKAIVYDKKHNFLYDRDKEKMIIKPTDYIYTYTIDKYNEDEKINLQAKDMFKSIPSDDYKVYTTDKDGYLIDDLKKEYKDYLKELLTKLMEVKFLDTDVSISTIENMIQKQTGEATTRYIELVSVNGDEYHYHITIDTNLKENRNVLVVPFTVNIKNKTILRHNKNILFVSPWNVYNGLSEFFNTYLREYDLNKNKKYTKTLLDDSYITYKQETSRYNQKYYRDYLNEEMLGYDSKYLDGKLKYTEDKEKIVKQFREYTDNVERKLRSISNIGIDARRESSRRKQNF